MFSFAEWRAEDERIFAHASVDASEVSDIESDTSGAPLEGDILASGTE